MNRNIRISIIVAVFLLGAIIMFLPQLSGSAFFWEDFAEQVYPVQNYAAVETALGNVPLWNPFSFGGMPFLADPQVGWFYPLNRLMGLFVSDGVLPVGIVQLFIILHFLIAQIAMFFFLRDLKRSYAAAMLGAVGYSFSMIFMCHVFHPMMIYQFAWFPLAFSLFKKALDKRCILYGLWSGLVFAMMFHAGHPQTTVYLLLITIFYFLWDFISNLRNKQFESGRAIAQFVAAAAVVGIVATGIYMVQLLPTRQLQANAVRSEMTYEKTAEGSLEYKQIFQSVIPKLFGEIKGNNNTPQAGNSFHLSQKGNPLPYYYYWDTGYYFGIAILLLGLVGALAGFKKKVPAFMIFIAIFGIFYALGNNFFLHPILNKLPVLNYFRMPGRIMIIAVFAFSSLAAYGFDYLSDANYKSSKRRNTLFWASVFPVLVIGGTILSIIPNLIDTPQSSLSFVKGQAGLALLFFLITLAGSFMLLKVKKTATIFAIGSFLTLALFIDLYLSGHELNIRSEKIDDMTGRSVPFSIKSEYELPQTLKGTIIPNLPKDIFRTNTRIPKPINYPVIKRNAGMINRVLMTDGYNQLNLDYRIPPFENRQDANDMLNVRYVFQVNDGGIVFYDNQKTTYGAFRMYHDYKVMSPAEQKEDIKNLAHDYRKTVLLDGTPTLKMPAMQNDSTTINSQIQCKEYESNHITCEVQTDENGIMVFSEIWYPAWVAYIDGQKTPVYRANYSLRAIEVPAGKHTIEMRYESEAFQKGGMISMLTLIFSILGLIGFAVGSRIKKCKQEKSCSN